VRPGLSPVSTVKLLLIRAFHRVYSHTVKVLDPALRRCSHELLLLPTVPELLLKLSDKSHVGATLGGLAPSNRAGGRTVHLRARMQPHGHSPFDFALRTRRRLLSRLEHAPGDLPLLRGHSEGLIDELREGVGGCRGTVHGAPLCLSEGGERLHGTIDGWKGVEGVGGEEGKVEGLFGEGELKKIVLLLGGAPPAPVPTFRARPTQKNRFVAFVGDNTAGEIDYSSSFAWPLECAV